MTAAPGYSSCEQLTRTGVNAFTAAVVLGVGPVKGHFTANVALSDLDEPRAAKLSGDLSGPLGAASGEGWLTLTRHENAAVSTIDTPFTFRAAPR